MKIENRFTEEELRAQHKNNYELVTDMAQKLQMLKGYEMGYSNPKKGKMIINKDRKNFIVDIEYIGDGTLEEAMSVNGFIFK